jgi:solute carrier family 35, member F5
MLLTSPLVVTVGLSLTIPLSLVGQMILDSQFSSPAYWFGAGIVFLSFIVINRESKEEQSQPFDEGMIGRGLLTEAS